MILSLRIVHSLSPIPERALEAARRSVDLLSAPPVKGGIYTVVLNPTMTGVFAHEAFGHLSESDFVYENDRMKELMVLGNRFGPEGLNIVDDGTFPGQLGTIRYDDEGVPASKTYLIREGVLVGRLHSRETAARMNEDEKLESAEIFFSATISLKPYFSSLLLASSSLKPLKLVLSSFTASSAVSECHFRAGIASSDSVGRLLYK